MDNQKFIDWLNGDYPMLQEIFGEWLAKLIQFGAQVLLAIVVFLLGRYLILFIKKSLKKGLTKRNADPTISNFILSVTQLSLMVVLVVVVIGVLGIEVVTFAALLASVGVGVGMALSKQLQNFAGGIVMVFTKPISVGDSIEAQGVSGTVEAIEIFHTLVKTFDGKRVYIPNGSLSDGVIINYSRLDRRRLDWTFSIEYDEDFERVYTLLKKMIDEDDRILTDPGAAIHLDKLNDSSVDVLVRVWCKSSDYWSLYWDFNKKVYKAFTDEGIIIPFQTITIFDPKSKNKA